MIFYIFIIAIFFALNMGGSNFAASFAAAYGSKTVSYKRAVLLFGLFVVLGALLMGQGVSKTLGDKIVDPTVLNIQTIAIIFSAASLSMFVANIMNVPQATSVVTVAAIAGIGLYFGNVQWPTVGFLSLFWFALPLLCYVTTRWLVGYCYPPRSQNFWIYEKLVNQAKRLKWLVVAASCYNAFSVGANNVPNVVGPMMGLNLWPTTTGLFEIAVVFAFGALIFKGPITSAGKNIVPIGSLSAAIVLITSGTFMILASAWGVPQSIAMMKMSALFAVSSLKKGNTFTFSDPTVVKSFFTWTINPLITLLIVYGLCWLFLG